MSRVWLEEIETLKRSIRDISEDRDRWRQGCIDMVIYEQHGYNRISYERHKEIFDMCHDQIAIQNKARFV